MSFTAKHRDDLEEKGYTIIENAVPDHQALRKSFFNWVDSTFGEDGKPYSSNSIVRHYSVGYLEPAWKVRLQVKKYFEALWGTDRLFTSVDAVAIGQPPEMGNEEFDSDHHHWLHVDQGASRVGLHAYQGAVYLETAEHDDWTFEVLEGSHKHLEQLYRHDKKAALRSSSRHFLMLEDEVGWFEARGCRRLRVAAEAGSLVLWDSRLVHGNARPVRGRRHPDRWRCVTFVCMTPVAWSTRGDVERKKKAYRNLEHTSHWPSDGVTLCGTGQENGVYHPRSAAPPLPYTATMPPVGKSLAARQLVGVTPYTKVKGSREVAWRPKWDPELDPDMAAKTRHLYTGDSSLVTVGKYFLIAIAGLMFSVAVSFLLM